MAARKAQQQSDSEIQIDIKCILNMIQTISSIEDTIASSQDAPNRNLQSQSPVNLPAQQENEAAPTPLFATETINRLLTAAVVNRRFCRQLLQNPGAAIAAGYHKEKFIFSTDELAILHSIRVRTLAEFAQMVTSLARRTVR